MKKTLLPLLLIALLTSFTSPILSTVNVSKANSTPTIDGVEPAEPKQLPYKQWLSILGSGFTKESSVNLSIGTFNKRIPPERTEYISPNKIYVLVGLTDAGTWKAVVENPGGLLSDPYSFEVKPAKTLATIDEHLLDLIDQYASDYFRDIWNITLDQYKAWIATIAWGEGGLGGYTAHSQSGKEDVIALDGDRFDHFVAGDRFRFSTGIGPFQIDRGGYDYAVYGKYGKWGVMPTIMKLDPVIALYEVLYWHYEEGDFGKDTTLNDFQAEAKTVWFAVSDAKVAQNWYQVTGTS
jgi:hypothetical protein